MLPSPSRKKRKIIAVAGKGGSGKTTFVALMLKILVRGQNLKVLAIDADSAISLPFALGIEVKKTIGDIRRQIIENPKVRKEMENIHISKVIAEALEVGKGFHLLAMGRPEGPGCYCAVNDLLRYGIERLSKDFDLTIIDCEAGPEQINRRVTQGVDLLILMTEATLRSIHTATLIKNITQVDESMRSTQIGLVMNRSKQEGNSIGVKAQESGHVVFGYIPEDENITKYDSLGKPLIDLPDTSPSVIAVEEILRKLSL